MEFKPVSTDVMEGITFQGSIPCDLIRSERSKVTTTKTIVQFQCDRRSH